MKNLAKIMLAAILVGLFAVNVGKLMRVEAQTPSPWSFSVSAPHASCPVAAPGISQYCFATDGIWQSLNGGAWAQVGIAQASPITINSKTGTSFTITATASPAVSVSVN